MNRPGLRVQGWPGYSAYSYKTARSIMALYAVGDRIHASLLRCAGSILIGIGRPSRQYELELY